MNKFKTYQEFSMLNETAGITGRLDIVNITKFLSNYARYIQVINKIKKNDNVFYDKNENKYDKLVTIGSISFPQKLNNSNTEKVYFVYDVEGILPFKTMLSGSWRNLIILSENWTTTPFLIQLESIAHELAHFVFPPQKNKFIRPEKYKKMTSDEYLNIYRRDDMRNYLYYASPDEKNAYPEGISYLISYLLKIHPEKKEEVKNCLRKGNVDFDDIFYEFDELYAYLKSHKKIFEISEIAKRKLIKNISTTIDDNSILIEPIMEIFVDMGFFKKEEEKFQMIKSTIKKMAIKNDLKQNQSRVNTFYPSTKNQTFSNIVRFNKIYERK